MKKFLKKYGITTAALLMGLVLMGIAVKFQGFSGKNAAIAGGILLITAAAGVLPKDKLPKWASVVILVLSVVGSFVLMECYTHDPWKMAPSPTILNLIVFALIFLVLSGLCKKVCVAAPLANLITCLIGLANYYTILFRDNPILPWDILSVKTAFSVTSNYTFSVEYRQLFITLGFLFLMVLGTKITLEISGWKWRSVAAITGICAILGLNSLMHIQAVTDRVLTFSNLFTQKFTYRDNGFFISFMNNLQYLSIDVPEGYSEEKVSEIVKEYAVVGGEETEKRPNIIVIMDEAFSDLSVLTEFETNEDYMPFLRSLMAGEDAVSGNLYVSVCGGNTANTEYEFLTGDTTAFLPDGSVAYQQYVKDVMPNLTDQLLGMGYETLSIHPYNTGGWNRNTVYKWFGFEEMRFRKHFHGPEIIRSYVSDREVFNRILSEIQSSDPEKPLFTFAVTMQNHGGYSKLYDNSPITITLSGMEGEYPATENYLSLVKRTDDALAEFIGKVEQLEEETVVVFFGDHQPSDYGARGVLNQMDGESTFEDQMNRYQVPFVIWANYDIEEKQYERLSINYLSTIMMDALDLPMTDYQKYLLNLSEQLPVVTAIGCIDAEGNHYRVKDDAVQDLLHPYSIVQYNHLFGKEDRVDEIFTLPQ